MHDAIISYISTRSSNRDYINIYVHTYVYDRFTSCRSYEIVGVVALWVWRGGIYLVKMLNLSFLGFAFVGRDIYKILKLLWMRHLGCATHLVTRNNNH